MAISNELSGDIAVAMLAETNNSERTRKELKETILKIHALLQTMDEQARKTGKPREALIQSDASLEARS